MAERALASSSAACARVCSAAALPSAVARVASAVARVAAAAASALVIMECASAAVLDSRADASEVAFSKATSALLLLSTARRVVLERAVHLNDHAVGGLEALVVVPVGLLRAAVLHALRQALVAVLARPA